MLHLSIWRARVAILTLMAGALVGGCGQGDDQGSLEPPPPPPPPAFSALELRPASAHLAVGAPGNLVRLYAVPLAEDGAPLFESTVTAFSSSSPAIATVTGSGVVTAVAPGAAEITATATVRGITRSASMLVTVHPPDSAAAHLGGVYDLSALITQSDTAWGIPNGTTQTALLTLVQAPGTSVLTGTFTELRASNSDPGDPGLSGTVGGSVSPNGWVVIDLFLEQGQNSHWHGEGVLDSGHIVGSYGCCGHISGTFMAERRPGPGSGKTRLRVIHAAAGDLGVRVNNAPVLNGLTYLSASDYLELPEDSWRVTFTLSNGWAGGETETNLFYGHDNTVIVAGSAAWGAVVTRLMDDNRAPEPGKARVRLFNEYGTLDFYLTAPDADLATEKATSTLGRSGTSP